MKNRSRDGLVAKGLLVWFRTKTKFHGFGVTKAREGQYVIP